MRLRRSVVAVCSALLVHGLAFCDAARAADAAPAAAPAQAPASPYPGPAPEAAPADPDADQVLRRILRSGCRDGLPDARALAVTGGAPWAATVSRLCGEILAAPQPVAAAPLAAPHERERNGRAAIVIGSTAYGIWLGVATDVLLENDNVRGAIVPPLVGMGAGLALSLFVTADHRIDNGQAWTIITGYDYGSINGALWAGGLNLSAKGVVGTALATGLSASAIGLLAAVKLHPRQGDIEVVRSGLLWGTVSGLLVMGIVQESSSETVLRGAGLSMDLGFLAGLGLAASFDVSRNRDLIIDAGAAGGGIVGFGVTWLIANGPANSNGRAFAAGTLAGVFAGMGLMIYLTRNMDLDDDDSGPRAAALLGRDARGRWTWGAPGAAPVFDGTGHRFVGATLTALGGTF